MVKRYEASLSKKSLTIETLYYDKLLLIFNKHRNLILQHRTQ
jgi:hypothetical protein